MTTMKISKEVRQKAINWLNENPYKNEWDYRESLSRDDLRDAINDTIKFESNICDLNLEFISQCEIWTIEGMQQEIEELEGFNPYDLRDEFMEYVRVDMNINKLIDGAGEIPFLIYVYSNYDCTNSFDVIEDGGYLHQVLGRVKTGVKKQDFIWEHTNGAYGGSLFCFLMKGSVSEIIDLKSKVEKEDYIHIPKGTQFGFFSSFQGAGSVFDKVTYRSFNLNTRETGKDFNPEYDCIGVIADVEQSYSMMEVYGCDLV